MYKLIRLITLASGAHGEALADGLRALAARHGAFRALIAPTLSGGHNGGDMIAHVQFPTEHACATFELAAARFLSVAAVFSVEGVDYQGTADLDLSDGLYRVLLLSVNDGVDADIEADFETEMRTMPRYIPAIRNWQLSRVDAALGARRWTHVWEQDFADASALLGPYMLHPYHWGHVDRWFDPEHPGRIVDTHICHSFCTIDGHLS